MCPRALALSVCGVVATWPGGEPARACQVTTLGASPWSEGGDKLPARGALYLGGHRWAPGDVVVPSGDVRWGVTRVNDETIRIDYDAGSAMTFSVHFPRSGATWDYAIAAAWQPPATAPHMVQVWRRVDSESWCHGADGLAFQVDQPVQAMEVTLISSTGARLERTLLPYPSRLGPDDRSGVVRLEPGALDDAERTILADAWLAHLRAVDADGTVVDVGGSPFFVGPEFVPVVSDQAFDAVGIVPMPPAQPAVAPAAPAAPETSRKAAPLLSAVLGLLLAAGAVAWRLRVRPPLSPT